MKIRGAKSVHYDSGPNMTPLVDVVMVLLIFLMLAGTFTGTEHFLVSTLPYTKAGGGRTAPPPGGFPEDVPLEIRVDTTSGRDGFVARVGQYQSNNEQKLQADLVQMRQQFAAQLGKGTDKIQIKISPGANVKYEHLIKVYEAALRAEFTKIGFTPAR